MKLFRRKTTPVAPTGNNHTIKPRKNKKNAPLFIISKRQKFVTAVILLSIGLFFSGNTQLGNNAFQIAATLAIFTDLFLLWSVYRDLRENFTGSIFILPFFYSLAFGMFYFLVPARLLFRIPASVVYAFGLYSLFLSQNVFAVSSVRTIALLSGARIVSFVITLLSFFFLMNTLFSLHLPILPVAGIVTLCSYLLIYQSIRTYALQKAEYPTLWQWSIGVTLCLLESVVALWFWPSSPTIIALFLSGFFYTLVGLSHIWFERRLFKSVLWEYVWVGVVVFFVLVAFTQWGK